MHIKYLLNTLVTQSYILFQVDNKANICSVEMWQLQLENLLPHAVI